MQSITRSQNQPVVLFLVDDQDTRELVHLTLGLAGIRVHSVTTRADAWTIALENEFNLYLLDGKLPDGESFQLCADLRELAPEKPIVFYSALAFPNDMLRAFDAGATAYLKKPFEGDLGAEINEILRAGKRLETKVDEDNWWIEDSVQIIEPANYFPRTDETYQNVADNVIPFVKR